MRFITSRFLIADLSLSRRLDRFFASINRGLCKEIALRLIWRRLIDHTFRVLSIVRTGFNSYLQNLSSFRIFHSFGTFDEKKTLHESLLSSIHQQKFIYLHAGKKFVEPNDIYSTKHNVIQKKELIGKKILVRIKIDYFKLNTIYSKELKISLHNWLSKLNMFDWFNKSFFWQWVYLYRMWLQKPERCKSFGFQLWINRKYQ